MDDTYGIPTKDRICRAFAFACAQTWSELRDFGELGEESITDYRILELRRMCPDEVKVIKFNRPREARTGADWEWWFGAANKWFGMRVQAKRLDCASLAYEYLDHKIGKTGVLQVDRLIADALSRNLYAMYCFYNYWDRGNYIPEWPCGTFGPRLELWGASIADAIKVQQKIGANSKELSDIEPISMPLLCLACCRGHSDDPSATLPHRARGIALRLSGTSNIVPQLVDRLPGYVTQDSLAQVDIQGPTRDLDGILVIEERLNVYGERDEIGKSLGLP
jgi:hypothetical protein